MNSTHISSENTSFNYLRGSPDFLNLVLNSISSCILMLDKDMKLYAFNDALKTIFSNKQNEHLLYQICGDAIGCAYSVESAEQCGSTTHCKKCLLRKCAIMTYSEGIIFHKNRFSREFYTKDGVKEMKHLQFSTRHISFHDDRYVIVVVDDLSQIVEQNEKIEQQQKLIEVLEHQ